MTVLLVLAGLPLLARWLFGPPAAGPPARLLRAGAYEAVLVLTVAKASVEQVVNAPPVVARQAASGRGLQPLAFTWFAETLFLLIVAGYVAAILVMTARRSRVAPATPAIGTGAGIVLGVVMCAVAPLGLSNDATEPWLAGSAIDPVVALAWILLLCGPLAAGGMAGRLYRGPDSPSQVDTARVWQGAAAGFLATGIGALIVTVVGTGTIALMPRSGGLLHWLYPGQHLSAAVVRERELWASLNASGYFLILLAFPVIGLILGAPASSWTHIFPPRRSRRSAGKPAARPVPAGSRRPGWHGPGAA